jgi:hypothetical protein
MEALGDCARLVRLQPPDEMPRGIQVGEGVHLRQRFLHVALPEIAASGVVRRANRVGRLRLRHRDQPHRAAIPL